VCAVLNCVCAVFNCVYAVFYCVCAVCDCVSGVWQVGGGAQVVKERRVKAPVNQLQQQQQQQLTNINGADHVAWLARQFGGVTSYTRLTQPSNHIDVVLGSAGREYEFNNN
jgi:hypothetical protein